MRLRDVLLTLPTALAGVLVKRDPKAWAIIFDRRQNVEGNAFALANYLDSLPDVSVTILDHRLQASPIPLAPNSRIRVVRGGSWQEWLIRLRARQVVVSDRLKPVWGPFRWLRDVRIVNVWHGIPVKGMGNMAAGFPRSELAAEFREWSRIHTFCVSSELERSFIAACFLLDAEKIRVTGSPRADMLTNPTRMNWRQQQLDSDIAATKQNRKMILYAPTFRDYQVGASGLSRTDFVRLNERLAAANVLLAVRPHPREADTYDALIENLSHVIPADSRRWEDGNVLLRHSDALVTDYSSMWLEFLLLGRPMAAFWWDLDRYAADRGFLVDIAALFPGPRAMSVEDLERCIAQWLQSDFALTDADRQAYENMRRLFHRYSDGQGCERVVAVAST